MFLVVLLAILVLLIWTYLRRSVNYWTRLGVKQLKQHIIFGSLYENSTGNKSLAEIIQENYKAFKNERYFGMYQFLRPVLVIKDPELITELTIKNVDTFSDHQAHARLDVDYYWSKGIAALRGKEWQNARATLSPAFTSSKMKFMFPLVDECARKYVDHFSNDRQDLVKLEMKDTFMKVGIDMIVACCFGIKIDSLGNPNNDFHRICRDGFDFSKGFKRMAFLAFGTCPKLMKLIGAKIYKKELTDFFKEITVKIMKMRDENEISQPHLIHLMMQARAGNLLDEDNESGYANKKKADLSDDDIIAYILIFFFGGLDTTSFLMAFIAYELAVNKDVQDRLRDEIDEYFDSTSNEELEYQALIQMKYLDMVVLETLRKWPILFALDRKASKDFVIEPKNSSEKRVVIRKDDIIWIPAHGLHRDPEIYPDPERFDPERFNGENKSKINAAAYVGFGVGPRFCIGNRLAYMECKAIFARILRKFEIVPLQETKIPFKISTIHFNTTAEGGSWLGFKKR